MANFTATKLGLPTVMTECSWLGAGWLRFFHYCHRISNWGNWPTLLSGVSHCVADQLAAISGRNDVFILHNGVRVEDWKTEGCAQGPPVVVSVMRFTKRKRPIDIVRAIPRVNERLPESLRPRFVLIGDGRERQRVIREARRLGVLSQLELPGFLDRKEIRRRFENASVFALPTEREAMSIVCVEALAAGLPVVAMNMGGVSDVVAQGEEGYLCGSASEFVNSIARLVSDTAQRQKMAAAAATRVERFSWERVIERHLNIFELAIAKSKQQPTPQLSRYGMPDLAQWQT
jgi:glycosyltransferase involved in cell wall biosynthesis